MLPRCRSAVHPTLLRAARPRLSWMQPLGLSAVCVVLTTLIIRWPADTNSVFLRAFSWQFVILSESHCRQAYLLRIGCGRLSGLIFAPPRWNPWMTEHSLSPDRGSGTVFVMTSLAVCSIRYFRRKRKAYIWDICILISIFDLIRLIIFFLSGCADFTQIHKPLQIIALYCCMKLLIDDARNVRRHPGESKWTRNCQPC
jgi:hypothetical protein